MDNPPPSSTNDLNEYHQSSDGFIHWCPFCRRKLHDPLVPLSAIGIDDLPDTVLAQIRDQYFAGYSLPSEVHTYAQPDADMDDCTKKKKVHPSVQEEIDAAESIFAQFGLVQLSNEELEDSKKEQTKLVSATVKKESAGAAKHLQNPYCKTTLKRKRDADKQWAPYEADVGQTNMQTVKVLHAGTTYKTNYDDSK